jgi:hypothetical protein
LSQPQALSLPMCKPTSPGKSPTKRKLPDFL